jgi:predicted transcriptional regulator
MATSIKLDEKIKGRIQRLAEIQHRTPHWIMKKAIVDYVEREELRENFKQEAISSWQSYQETGLHLNNKETLNWLSQWGTDTESGIPDCHK